MTIEDLTIDDLLVTRFKTNCRAHFAIGGGRPVERARIKFFSELRQDYPLDGFTRHLPAIYKQFDIWEEETQAEELPEAA